VQMLPDIENVAENPPGSILELIRIGLQLFSFVQREFSSSPLTEAERESILRPRMSADSFCAKEINLMRLERRQKVAIVSLLALPIVAMATPGAGYIFKYSFNRFTSTADAIHERAHDTERSWSVQLNVEGATDFVQEDVMLSPGGFTGWHSHPGPVLITVKSGTATWYSDNPSCTAIVYGTGSAFIEPATVHHYIANKGLDSLELLDTSIVPKGQATRQEQPKPSQCPL